MPARSVTFAQNNDYHIYNRGAGRLAGKVTGTFEEPVTSCKIA